MAISSGTKREQIDKEKTRLFIILSVAAVVTIGSLVIAKGFISQGNYLHKVAGQKETAVKQLEQNKAAVDTLRTSYETFAGQNPNLLGGESQSVGDRGGTNADLVLDALPSKYDFPALTSSIEKLLAGYLINGISGSDDSAMQNSAGVVGPMEIPFAIDITTAYNDFKDLISSFNRSIRPIQITSIELRGTNSNLQASIQAKTFWQPEVGVQITEQQVN